MRQQHDPSSPLSLEAPLRLEALPLPSLLALAREFPRPRAVAALLPPLALALLALLSALARPPLAVGLRGGVLVMAAAAADHDNSRAPESRLSGVEAVPAELADVMVLSVGGSVARR